MLEETHDKTRELARGVHCTLDKAAAHCTLAFFYRCTLDPEVREEGFSDEADKGLFRTYHILVHLADYPGISLQQLGEDS